MNTTLTCEATKSTTDYTPSPSLIWVEDSKTVGSGSSLTLTNIQAEKHITCRMTATDDRGVEKTISSEFMVIVVWMETQPVPRIVQEGTDITLTCMATSKSDNTADVVVKWIKDNTETVKSETLTKTLKVSFSMCHILTASMTNY